MPGHRGMFIPPDQRKSWEIFYRQHGDPWRVRKDYRLEKYIEKDAFILDLCSGTGKASRTLVENGYRVVLLDFSMNSLKKSQGGEYGRIMGDAKSIPFRNSTFDCIIASHALSHLSEEGRKKAMGEIYRVSKENAILVFEGFSTDDFRYGKGVPVENNTFLRGNGIYTHYFTEDEVESMLSGWSILEKGKRVVERKIFGSIYKMATLIYIAKINKNKKVFMQAKHYV